MLEGESAPDDEESSWTEILVVFFLGSNVRSGGRTRFCCLSFDWFGVAVIVVAITCIEAEKCWVTKYLAATSHTRNLTSTMSTTYSLYRRQPTTDHAHDKYRRETQQLKEMFPDWPTEG